MRYTWLGHASFRLEIADQVLLVDPWTDGPTFPNDQRDQALSGATAILLTHAHFDHMADIPDIATELDVPVYCIADMADYLGAKGASAVGFNKGGTVKIGQVAVTMVNATHSSSFPVDGMPVYLGAEAGFMIAGEGKTIYVSGDTDVMADMAILNDLHEPEIGILCAGGHFTMDMARAAYAASKLFSFQTVIPYHYQTFPLLEQSAEPLKDALPDIRVLAPSVMETVEL
ncbi:MAG: metal-dependent hydrolase [Pseudomonadota bacterium]